MKVRSTLYAAILGLVIGSPMFGGQAHAASVSFVLDRSNAFDDNVNYLQVTIADGALGVIDFTVDILSALIAGNNFGIQNFGFSGPDGLMETSVTNLPGGWRATADRQLDGFGRFEMEVSGTGSNRQSLLMFSISDIDGDSPSDYAVLSTGNAGEVNVFFAAHVAGLNDDPDSAFFGGPVPIPPAVWLFGSGLVALLTFARRRTSA